MAKNEFFEQYNFPNHQTTKPTCEHFGECGGCRFQHISYEEQLNIKKEYLKKLFNTNIKITQAPNQYEYRNRMDFVYMNNTLGLRKRGDFKTVVNIAHCHLLPKETLPVFTKIKQLLKENNIEDYNQITHKGFLRYVVFRYAPTTKELMLIFTTTSKEDQLPEFNNMLDELSKEVKSIYHLVYDQWTDLSIPEVKPKKILGEQYITEKMQETKFLIGPLSFFQANTAVSSQIFDDLLTEVQGTTVDLCCGVGTIGLIAAKKAKSVIGIEIIKEAIDLANKNKEINNITNVSYFCDDMKNILEYVPLEIDTLIVDPPRAGLGKKVIKRILSLEPKKIIYVSCNPKTQKMDLDMLQGYVCTSLQAYDQFPQTNHIETLAILNKNP